MPSNSFPPFHTHPLIRGGHLQTLAGAFLATVKEPYRATQHHVILADGDRIVLHDDRPGDWRPGDRMVLLIHGLCGCHLSPYVQRLAAKLCRRGVRTFRMDMRGCGAGAGLARMPYHAGRSDDAAAALAHIEKLSPQSPVTLIGFSLGGNITLKLLGELGGQACGRLDSAVAVCPPVDLQVCVERLARLENLGYDRYFVRSLRAAALARGRMHPDAPSVALPRRRLRLWEFDDVYTAPVCGFGTAANYYRLASSAPLIPQIRLPTLIITSRDDPLVPCEPLERLPPSPHVELHIAAGGGHLGFVARRGADLDRRWLDWRLIEWVRPRPWG